MNYTEKNKLLDKISVIGLMAILVEVFLYAVDKVYTGEIGTILLKMPTILNVIGGAFLVVAVVLYVLAYKKSNSSKAVFATEFLILAFICPFLSHWYTASGAPLKDISPKVLWIIVLVYYVIRIVYASLKDYLQSSESSWISGLLLQP